MKTKKLFIVVALTLLCLLLVSCQKVASANADTDTAINKEASEIAATEAPPVSPTEIDVTEASPVSNEPVLLSNYFAQPSIDFDMYKESLTIRGIYVTATRAGGKSYMEELVELVNTTEINAMVIDVKTDDGMITYKGMQVPDEIGVSRNYISDIKSLMNTLDENNIYPIARIVCFKDNGAVDAYPDLYIKDASGNVWRDSSRIKSAWLNPYDKDAWDYVLEIAKTAAKDGFKEIQFDYIRFDTSSRLKDADFGDTGGKNRMEIILEFVKYAKEELAPYNVKVSADVYGTIINSDLDASIVGQDYAEMARYLDIICPMVYPSHYAANTMGLAYPDLEPYETIYRSMELSNKRLEAIPEGEHRAIVRPWLQDFTASWITPHIKYGAKERREQIQGSYDAGLTEWLLWDSSVSYQKEGLEPEGAEKQEPGRRKPEQPEPEQHDNE